VEERISLLHGFAEVAKNLARCRSENNFHH